MKFWKSFFGEIVDKNDFSFLNSGNREAIVETHNTITNNSGGIVQGLDLAISVDKKSLSVSAGSFYTSGIFSDKNNFGGGEQGEIFIQQNFSSLPETAPINGGTTPTYLLVYSKLTTTNVDPDPLKSNVIITSKNLETGENVSIREFPEANVVITNPLLFSTAQTIDGVRLGLIQVNYSGTTKLSSDGSIQFLDTSIRRNYTIGGTVDVKEQHLIDAGVPNQFLTNRMFKDNEIDANAKILDTSITTEKLAIYDGSAFNSLTGSGVANQQIKDGAITESKLNYNQSLDTYNNRNYLLNSSFEIFSSGNLASPDNWINVHDLANPSARKNTPSESSKFGFSSVILEATQVASSASNTTISQIVNFNENLKNIPITAFYWSKQMSLGAISGTGFQGTLDYLDSTGNPIGFSSTFGTLNTSTNSSDYIMYFTPSPVIYTGNSNATQIKFTIGGNFTGEYSVDGAFLGTTSIIPQFDINPSEYILQGAQIPFTDITGTINPATQIANASITSTQLAQNSVDTGQLSDNSVTTSKLDDGSVTALKIANNTITSSQMANNSIVTSNITNGSVTLDKLDNATVGAALCKAWGNFYSPAGGPTLRKVFNVSSISGASSANNLTVTFSTPMADNHYSVIVNANSVNGMPACAIAAAFNLTTNGFNINLKDASATLVDADTVFFQVFD